MRLLSGSLIATFFLVGAPQVVCQTAVSEPLRWVSDIEQFEQADRVHPPVPGSIVFVGSSSIAMWETLEKDFGYFPVLNRGISGSMLADNVQSVYRIVLPYKPPLVVIYAGENDLVEGETPDRVLHDYQTFTSIVHRKLPTTRVVFVSIKPSIARDSLTGKIRETNRLISNFTRTDKRLGYVDVFTPMLDASGRPRRDLFLGDGLHMNARGYAIWREKIMPVLR
jgi:lysophospholipase L1-like esterase